MIKSIKKVCVYVEDQQKSKKFWLEKAGFQLVAETPMGDGYWMEVAPPGAETVLVIYPRQQMKNWERMQPSFIFECDDIRETYERMKANGVKFLSEPAAMEWGTFAQFEDADGYAYFLREKEN